MTNNILRRRLDEIDCDLITYPAMANAHDTAIQVALMDVAESASVCELGAGTGNWSGIVSRNLCKQDVKFTLVENFSQAEMYKDIGFPQNCNELSTHMNQFNIKFDIIEADVDDLPELDKTVDVMRIDCDGDYIKLTNWILENGSEKLIVFVDDVRPNVRVDRLLMMHELVRQNKLEFLWAGYEEAAWCKPNAIDKKGVVDLLRNTYPGNYDYDYIHLAHRHNLFGLDMTYIITRPHWTTHVPGL